MPVDYAKVQKIFLEVLKEPAGQNRVAIIDEACGTDIELRNFVRGMLEVHEKHATPIPQGPTRADDQTQGYSEPALVAGTILGDRYKIIELIAEGGMGSVYRACRISDMKMEVAIKVIKPGMDSQQVLARFNIERQALAMMKHENIAQVLDAGMTEKRLPYFVMELIKGLSLTKFCDDSKLTIEQRLELFEQICSAVQHAHHKGIVHRDLKPSNILVALFDNKAVPKVIDFGLAKALYQPLTDDDIRTKFGMFVGTWQYTAPEQAKLNNLDIDTRADIYSLGVILYELLTGATPMEKDRLVRAAYDEVMRIIQEEEPPKPSTKIHSSDELPSIAALRHTEPVKLEKQIRGELDWIVMKALEKDRNRRYATANEFAADVRRYILDEPVQAGPVTLRYRLYKTLRKHKGKLIAASLLAAAILIGSIVSTIGWITAVRERNRADANLEIAQANTDFLTKDLLAEADPSVQIKPGQNFVSNITVKKALDHAAAKVGDRYSGKPLTEAAIRHTIGKTYLGIGDLDKAKFQMERAEELRRKHAGEQDSQRLSSLHELGWIYLNATLHDRSEVAFKEVVRLRENSLGANHSDTLRSKYGLALLFDTQNKSDEARQIYRQVLSIQKKELSLNHPDTQATQRELATSLSGLENSVEAELLFRELLEHQLVTPGKEHPETLITQNNYASYLEQKGELVRAESILKDVLRISEKIHTKEHPSHLSYLCSLAGVYYSQKRYSEAIAVYREIIPPLKRVKGLTSEETLVATQNLAISLVKMEKPAEAEPLLVEVYAGCKQAFGSDHPHTKMVLESLIEVYRLLKNEVKMKQYQQLLK